MDSTEPSTDFARIYSDADTQAVLETMREFIRARGEQTVNRLGRSPGDVLISSGGGWGNEDIDTMSHPDVACDFRQVADMLLGEYDAVFGPKIALVGTREAVPVIGNASIVLADFESDDEPADQLRPAPVVLNDFYESPLWRASCAYKRECGWDHAPGEDGCWLLYCLTVDRSGSSESDDWRYGANLAGFVILHDRDADDRWGIAHMWTAQAARRKGVAKALIEDARRRFNVEGVEGPVTESGTAAIKSAAPDLLTQIT
jgi:hypothetical protein